MGTLRYTWICCSLVILISCSPEKKIQRIVKKHPHLLVADTVTVHDTIIRQAYIYDTTTVLLPHKTVEVINNERVRLLYHYDTITKDIRHEVECKADTVIKVHEIPVKTIEVHEAKKTDFKFWALLGCVALGLVAFLVKKS